MFNSWMVLDSYVKLEKIQGCLETVAMETFKVEKWQKLHQIHV